MINPDFWRKLDELISSCKIVIDRPKGTRHPRYTEVVYGVDYGYLEGTSSMDGDGIDLYMGTLPEKTLSGIIATVDMVKKDSEIKLLLGVTKEELDWILHWCNDTELMKGLYIPREG